jgi:uncharacterized protein YigE (DUF2233 family)
MPDLIAICSMLKKVVFVVIAVLISALFFQFSENRDSDFITYTVNPEKETVALFWKNNQNETFGSIQKLKSWLSNNQKELVFAMNGGMYKKDQSPQGLFIQNYIGKAPIDTADGNGNFYLKPNGIFYMTSSKKAFVVSTEDFNPNKSIEFATQSGPMLVVDGSIHKAFNKNSTNLNIRNGVGILPNNEILFAMSTKEVSFYEFADFFMRKGCKNALYLDGLVSRMYHPKANWLQTDGNFGAIIGIIKDK